MDEKNGIGKNNNLLFRIPEDFKRMKQLTSGHPIIMGRKTFESIGRVLPNRTNIIITKDTAFDHHKFCSSEKCDVFVRHSLEEAIKLAEETESQRPVVIARNVVTKQSQDVQQEIVPPRQGRARNDNKGEIFIFGGGQVFKEALEKGLVDKLYLTIVEARLDSPSPASTCRRRGESARRGDFGADTFFPDYSEFTKKVFEKKGKFGEYKYRFVDLEK